MTDTAAPAAQKSGPRISGAFHRLLAFSGLIALVVAFSLASPNFMQTQNILAILQATSVNGVLAIAATLVIITGGIDLSVGTLMTFCAVIAGVILTYLGLPLPLGVIGAILAGAQQMAVEAGAGGQHLRHRDGDVGGGRSGLLGIEIERAGDVAEQAEIGREAEMIDFPADQSVAGIGGIGAAGDEADVLLARKLPRLLGDQRRGDQGGGGE